MNTNPIEKDSTEAKPTRRRGLDIWHYVEKTEACWLWTGCILTLGYGQYRNKLAHRVAYELLVGPIPEGLTLDHLCRVRHCVNPDHLEPVTMRENILRGTSPSAINARKKHCPEGHPFDLVNTYIRSRGHRNCRLCNRDRMRVRRNQIEVLGA